MTVTVVAWPSNNITITAYTDASATPTTAVASFVNSLGGATQIPLTFVVLSGNYYKVTKSGTASLNSWTEWY